MSPPERVLFSTRRYVSNGRVPDLTHIVYVDPEAYDALQRHEDLTDVGRAVGRLNKRAAAPAIHAHRPRPLGQPR